MESELDYVFKVLIKQLFESIKCVVERQLHVLLNLQFIAKSLQFECIKFIFNQLFNLPIPQGELFIGSVSMMLALVHKYSLFAT